MQLLPLLLAVLACLAIRSVDAAPGNVERPAGTDNAVYDIATQADGKRIIAGSFKSVDGVYRPGIARLNADGLLDRSFLDLPVRLVGNSEVRCVALQEDGKILVGGHFLEAGHVLRNRIARLLSNGTVDVGFNPNVDGSVLCMAVQTDGNILIGGSFNHVGGIPRQSIARLDEDGNVDLSFTVNTNGAVNSLAIDGGGRILIGGTFTLAAGSLRNRIARLDVNGNLEASFDPNVDGTVNAISLATDGRIDLGGAFSYVGGEPRSRVARLETDGSLNGSFDPSVGNVVYSLVSQVDGKVLVGRTNAFEQLNSDGSLNNKFFQSSYFGFAPVSQVLSIEVGVNGEIAAGGIFSEFGQPYDSPESIFVSARNFVELKPDGTPRFYLGATFSPANRQTFTVQPDGKILVVEYDGVTRRHPDGIYDPSFISPSLSSVNSLVVQPDKKILVGGSFGVTRLNADGKTDAAFMPGSGSDVHCVALQKDGKIIIAGDFTTFGGVARNRIMRLNADGSPDPSFNASADASVHCILIQTDGRILISGNFLQVNGATRNRLARLNVDGTVEGLNYSLSHEARCMALQSDGKILVGGQFTAGNGLVRLSSTGVLDSGFNPADHAVKPSSITIQADGKILVENTFSNGGSYQTRMSRLNPDGSLDLTFAPEPADNFIKAIMLQENGGILIGGGFKRFESLQAGQPRLSRSGLARLANDPATSTVSKVSSTTVRWMRGGTAPEVQSVAFELLTQGSGSWTSLNGNASRIAGGWQLSGLALPASGLIRAHTQVRGAYSNRSAGLSESRQAFGVSLPPILEMADVSGDLIENLDAGSALVGNTRAFTIKLRNRGVGSLTGINLSFSGAHPGDFSIQGRIVEPLVALEETSFAIEFTPGGSGTRSATMQITGDHPSMVPITLVVSGNGVPTLTPVFNSEADIPHSYLGFNASGLSLGTLTLGFAPSLGTILTVVQNTSSVASVGMLYDLPAESLVNATFEGQTYAFMAGYHGGSGNDLVLTLLGLGLPDSGFRPNINSTVSSTAIQPDGNVLIGGYFTQVDGLPRNRIARLIADGNSDPNFNPDANGPVESVNLLPSGEILVAGGFTTVGGISRNRVALLNSTGSLVAGFDPNANGAVNTVVPLADGRILIGGTFTSVGGQVRNRIARLLQDGAVDPAFSTNVGGSSFGAVYGMAIQADGKILVSGNFSSVNGQNRSSLVRLEPNGTLDSGFNPFFTSNSIVGGKDITAIAVQADGKILFTGFLISVNGVPVNGIARLNANGSHDSTFAPVVQGSIESMVLQSDGKIIIGGSFSRVGGVLRSRIARILSDGSLEADFNPGVQSTVNSLALSPAGEIYAGGSFTSIAGVDRNRLARLANGAATSFLEQINSSTIRWFRGGTTPEAELVTFEWREQGFTDWSQPIKAQRTSDGWQIAGFDVPPLVTLRARAFVRSGDLCGSGYFVERLADFDRPPTSHESWRMQYFGRFGNSGPGADNEDFQGDGITNFIKFATGQVPTFRGKQPGNFELASDEMIFTYPRSVAAMRGGMQYAGQSSLTFCEGSWSGDGVSETIESEIDGIQQIRVAIPRNGAMRQFVRLRIYKP